MPLVHVGRAASFVAGALLLGGCGRLDYDRHDAAAVEPDGGRAATDASVDADGAIDSGGDVDAGGVIDAGTGVDAGGTADAGADVDAGPPPPNVVFVSTETFDGSTLAGVAGADGVCAREATAAGLPGVFVAWLSTASVAAPTRLLGARGWVRPDGKPVADRVEDLVAGRLYHPIRIDPEGADTLSSAVITGTSADGTAAPWRCDEYTSTTATALAGVSDATSVWWTQAGGQPCAGAFRIYCFQIDRSVPVMPAATDGRIAFVTGAMWPPGGGLASADAFCQAEAATVTLPGTFRALLATTTQSAIARFSLSGAPWVRIDGIPLAPSATAVTAAFLDAPIAVGVDGTYIGGSGTWGGANDVSSLATASTNCSDWTSSTPGAGAQAGWPSVTGRFFWSGHTADCSWSQRLFCLQE